MFGFEHYAIIAVQQEVLRNCNAPLFSITI